MILNGDVETGKTVLRDYINTELAVTSSGLTLLRSKRMVVFCAVWALPAMVRSFINNRAYLRQRSCKFQASTWLPVYTLRPFG